MSTVTPSRRLTASVALLAIVATLGALLGVSLPASADTATNQVVTTATTPYQTNVAPNGPLTGLKNLDVITLNATATGLGTPPANNIIFSMDARLCRTGLNISLTGQFNASAGNCIANPLSSASSAFVQKTFTAPNTSGTLTFIVGTGAETVATHVGGGSPIVCDAHNPCTLWLREAVPTGIVASGNAFVHFDLTFATLAPGAPTAVTATAGSGSANLSWTAPTNTGTAAITGYTVTSSPGGFTCTSATTSCAVSGLTAGTPYTFTVVATNGDALSSPSSAASNSVTPSGAPGAPTAVVATAGNGQAAVSFTAPASNGGLPITGYTVTSSPAGGSCTTATTGCTVTGLAAFTSYTFTVTATNAGPATGPASAPSNTVVPTATAPVITSAVAGNGAVTVTWTATSPAPVSYTVSSKQKTTSGPTCSTATTSCVVSGLTNGLPYTFVVTATFAGGTTVSAVSAAVTPKIVADLQSLNTAALTTARAGTFSVVEGVTNNGPSAASAKMAITVTNATETAVAPDAGLTCLAPVVVGNGFTQVCATDAPLASGATLNASLTLAPKADPLLTSIAVTNVVSLPVTMPTTYSDPLTTNNKISHTVKVFDTADLSASFTGASSVGRTGTYVADGTITNNGTDPVYAKFTIAVGYASEAGFTAEAGLTCTGPIANAAGTGFSRVCTSTAALASGASLHVQLQLAPSADPKKYGLTVSGTSAKASGNVTDPNTLNNKSALTVAITDSADLETMLSAPSTVSRAGTVTITGTITNNGPDTVSGKTIVSLVGGTISSVTSDAGLSCVGIGAKTTCTITTPVPAGTTLNFSIVVVPSIKTTVTSLTATSTASVLGGVTVSDSNLINNVDTATVAIV